MAIKNIRRKSVGKRVNKQLTPIEFAVHLLEQSNKINALEKFCNTYQHEMTRIVDGFNKANMELAKRIQVLESRVEDLEKLKVDESPWADSKFTTET